MRLQSVTVQRPPPPLYYEEELGELRHDPSDYPVESNSTNMLGMVLIWAFYFGLGFVVALGFVVGARLL